MAIRSDRTAAARCPISYDLYLWAGVDRDPATVWAQLSEHGAAGLPKIRAAWLVEALRRHLPSDALRIFHDTDTRTDTCIEGRGWECTVPGDEIEVVALQASWRAVKTDEGWRSLNDAAKVLAQELRLTVYDGQSDECWAPRAPATQAVFWSGHSDQPADVTWTQLQASLPDGVRALSGALIQRRVRDKLAGDEIVVDASGDPITLRGCGWSCALNPADNRFIAVEIAPALGETSVGKARQRQIIEAFATGLDCNTYMPASGWFEASAPESAEVKLLRDLWGTV